MTLRTRHALAALAASASLATATPASAQFWQAQDQEPKRPSGAPAVDLSKVGVDERLGAQLPLDTTLVDWNGRPFRFGSLFGHGRPVVLALVYYDCPMLCGLIQSGMAKTFRENGLVLGKDYDAVSVSFDPAETPALAAERRRGYLQSMGLPDTSDAWPFLVGPGPATRAIADAVGFHYVKDPATGEWAHIAAIMILTPDGRVSRYMYGIEFPPKDFRLAVVEAAGGRVGTALDRVLLTCYRYDPSTHKYEPYAWGIVRAGGALVLVALGGLIGGLVWRERRAAKARGAA